MSFLTIPNSDPEITAEVVYFSDDGEICETLDVPVLGWNVPDQDEEDLFIANAVAPPAALPIIPPGLRRGPHALRLSKGEFWWCPRGSWAPTGDPEAADERITESWKRDHKPRPRPAAVKAAS